MVSYLVSFVSSLSLSFYLGVLVITDTTVVQADVTGFEVMVRGPGPGDDIGLTHASGWDRPEIIQDHKTPESLATESGSSSSLRSVEQAVVRGKNKMAMEKDGGRLEVVSPWNSSFSILLNSMLQPTVFRKPAQQENRAPVKEILEQFFPDWIEGKMDLTVNSKRLLNRHGKDDGLPRYNKDGLSNVDKGGDSDIFDLEINITPLHTLLGDRKSSISKLFPDLFLNGLPLPHLNRRLCKHGHLRAKKILQRFRESYQQQRQQRKQQQQQQQQLLLLGNYLQEHPQPLQLNQQHRGENLEVSQITRPREESKDFTASKVDGTVVPTQKQFQQSEDESKKIDRVPWNLQGVSSQSSLKNGKLDRKNEALRGIGPTATQNEMLGEKDANPWYGILKENNQLILNYLQNVAKSPTKVFEYEGEDSLVHHMNAQQLHDGAGVRGKEIVSGNAVEVDSHDLEKDQESQMSNDMRDSDSPSGESVAVDRTNYVDAVKVDPLLDRLIVKDIDNPVAEGSNKVQQYNAMYKTSSKTDNLAVLGAKAMDDDEGIGEDNDKMKISRKEEKDMRPIYSLVDVLKRHQRGADESTNKATTRRDTDYGKKNGDGSSQQSFPANHQQNNPTHPSQKAPVEIFHHQKGVLKQMTGTKNGGDSRLNMKHDQESSSTKKHNSKAKDSVGDAVNGVEGGRGMATPTMAGDNRKDQHRKWFGVFSLDGPASNKSAGTELGSGPETGRHHIHQGAVGLVILGLMVSVILAVACTVSCVSSASNPGMRQANSRTALYMPSEYYDNNSNKRNNFGFIE